MSSIDFHRALVFPNNIRKFRKQLNIGSLLELSDRLPNITYIRLSKIERGEIFARAEELRDLGRALGVDPEKLLIDVDDPSFDIAAWSQPLHGPLPADPEGERKAVMLAAAVRARRGSDPALTIAAVESEYGIAPVVLSRIENALKPLDRWNEDVRASLRRLFGMESDDALADHIDALHAAGSLDPVLPLVANPELRLAKSRSRIAALRAELSGQAGEEPATHRRTPQKHSAGTRSARLPAPSIPPSAPPVVPVATAPRLLQVIGAPLADGLIAPTPLDLQVEAPRAAGSRAYALRIGRPTLGLGLPARAILVVDPDRHPAPGGLAVVREADALRVVSVTADRHGRMLGHSQIPDLEIAIDDLPPHDVAAVLSALFE